MAKVIEYSEATAPLQGLTEQERADVEAVADRLVERRQATGYAIHFDNN